MSWYGRIFVHSAFVAYSLFNLLEATGEVAGEVAEVTAEATAEGANLNPNSICVSER